MNFGQLSADQLGSMVRLTDTRRKWRVTAPLVGVEHSQAFDGQRVTILTLEVDDRRVTFEIPDTESQSQVDLLSGDAEPT